MEVFCFSNKQFLIFLYCLEIEIIVLLKSVDLAASRITQLESCILCRASSSVKEKKKSVGVVMCRICLLSQMCW